MAVQLIKDDNGKTQYAVIPYHEYFRMLLQMSEIDDETDDDLEDIEVEHDSLDDVELPGEVCSIMTSAKRQPTGRPAHFTRHVPAGGGGEAWHQPVRRVTAGSAGLPTAKAHPRKAGGNLRL